MSRLLGTGLVVIASSRMRVPGPHDPLGTDAWVLWGRDVVGGKPLQAHGPSFCQNAKRSAPPSTGMVVPVI